MSAWIVEKKHVTYLAAMATKTVGGQESLTWEYKGETHTLPTRTKRNLPFKSNPHAVKLATKLWSENRESVAARYSGSCADDLPGDRVRRITRKDVAEQTAHEFNAAQVIKSCNCLEYQSCEHEGWEGSEACAIVTALREKALRVALPDRKPSEEDAEDTIRASPAYGLAVWGSPEL